MGYCTSALVALGVIIKAGDTRTAVEQSQHGQDTTEEKKSDTTPLQTGEDYKGWLEEFCKQHSLSLKINDMTRHEQFGSSHNDKPVWDREFAVLPQHEQNTWNAKSLLFTEFWGHSACASVADAVSLDEVVLSIADRQNMDKLLTLLQLDPCKYKTKLVLLHCGD